MQIDNGSIEQTQAVSQTLDGHVKDSKGEVEKRKGTLFWKCNTVPLYIHLTDEGGRGVSQG